MTEKPPLAGTVKALAEVVAASLRVRAFVDITPAELRRRLDAGEPLTIVDCRAPRDFAEKHLPGAINVSYRTFMDDWRSVPTGQPIVAVCYVGAYSRAAAQQFARGGHAEVYNLVGGMKAWWAAHGEEDPDE